MGFSLSWVAVKGGSPQAVHELLGVRPTGERSEIPETAADGVALPGGWYAVVSDRDELKLTDESKLAALSALGEAVQCDVEDHVMVSGASGWRNGERVWSVVHDAQEDPLHLEVKGEPPPPFGEIRGRIFKDQEAEEKIDGRYETDFIYEIPVELAKALTGFRHDEDPPGGEDDALSFEILEPTRSKPSGSEAKSIWKRIFGG